MSAQTESGQSDCRFYLARDKGTCMVGAEIVDGCHSSPEYVAKAAKLMDRIFNDKGPWVMVEVHPMPELDPPINEQAAQDSADLVTEWGT